MLVKKHKQAGELSTERFLHVHEASMEIKVLKGT